MLDAGVADAIAFGRPFIANPDLVERIRRGRTQRAESEDLLFGRPAGYVDYPALDDAEAA